MLGEVSGNIKPRNAGADGAEEIRGDSADATGDEVGGEKVIAVEAVDGGDISESDVRDIGDVSHGDVHGNDTDDGSEDTVDQNVTFVAKRAMDAIAVAGGENGNFGWTAWA